MITEDAKNLVEQALYDERGLTIPEGLDWTVKKDGIYNWEIRLVGGNSSLKDHSAQVAGRHIREADNMDQLVSRIATQLSYAVSRYNESVEKEKMAQFLDAITEG